MFKNAIVYRIAPGWAPDLSALETALQGQRFAPCGPTQERSAGWIEPRGEAHAPLAESVGGQWLLRHMVEAKVVPGPVVKRETERRIAQVEQETGRKPGKKERKEIAEDALLALLPMAFTKQGSVPVWIDPEARLLVIGASAQGRADEIVTALVEALPGLALALLQTQQSAVAVMAAWLGGDEALAPPEAFTVDRECELKAADESKAAVRYARHPLDIEEIRGHIAQGKLPTRLALTWAGRVSFVLTEGMQVKKIAFLEGVFENTGAKDEGGFDADAAIATGELGGLLDDLVLALGGEVESGVLRAAAEEPGEVAREGRQPAVLGEDF